MRCVHRFFTPFRDDQTCLLAINSVSTSCEVKRLTFYGMHSWQSKHCTAHVSAGYVFDSPKEVNWAVTFEPPRDKTNRIVVHPAKTQISLGIRPVWLELSLFAWRKLGSIATHWAYSEDSDQTGRMPKLIWDFAGLTVILLVLSWGGSFVIAWLVTVCDVTVHCFMFENSFSVSIAAFSEISHKT